MDEEREAISEVAISIQNEENGSSTNYSKSKKMRKVLSRSYTHKLKRALNPHGKLVLIWTGIFYLSSVIAVSTDPFFLYIPIIKDHKCLGVDFKMMIITLVLRSITDFIFILHIVFRILQELDDEAFQNQSNNNNNNKGEPRSTQETWHDDNETRSKNGLSRRSKMVFDIINDILAVLPLPQVIILCFMSKMTSSKYLWDKGNVRIHLGNFMFLQYATRSFRILLLYNQLKWHVANRIFTTWVQSVLHILLYLTACHVGGSFYHLLSIQRETTCWYEACHKHKDGCINLSVFECSHDQQSNISSNDLTTFVNSFCNAEDSKAFDFGVFGDAIKSGILGSTDISVKFTETIWWGLRHLSTYGQNLNPTTGTILEVVFVACVSIFGLILFLFLIGTVQTFMQLEGIKSEDIRRKMKPKEKEVESWVKKHFLSHEIKETIMQKIHTDLSSLRKELEVEDVVDSLPPKHAKYIKRRLSYSTLKKVPILRNIRNEHEQVLEDFIDKSELVNYKENNYIIKEGEPLDLILVIIQGIVWTFDGTKHSNIDGGIDDSNNNILRIKSLAKGDFYGEELIEWTAWRFTEGFGVPISTTNVKTHTKVEALVLKYEDLRSIVEKHWQTIFSKLRPPPNYKLYRKLQQLAVILIQRTWKRRLMKRLHIH